MEAALQPLPSSSLKLQRVLVAFAAASFAGTLVQPSASLASMAFSSSAADDSVRSSQFFSQRSFAPCCPVTLQRVAEGMSKPLRPMIFRRCRSAKLARA
jgi:hypothetical protein